MVARNGRSPRHWLFVACVFGLGTGVGGAYLLAATAPRIAEQCAAQIRAAITFVMPGLYAPPPVERSDKAITSGYAVHLAIPPRPDAPEAHPAEVAHTGEPRQESPPAQAAPKPPSELVTGGQATEFLTAKEQVERQLAEHRLEQPLGDNALESYRRLASRWPDEPEVVRLGARLGVTFWLLGSDARAAGNRGEALHYFAVVNTLPSMPRATASLDGEAASTGSSQQMPHASGEN